MVKQRGSIKRYSSSNPPGSTRPSNRFAAKDWLLLLLPFLLVGATFAYLTMVQAKPAPVAVTPAAAAEVAAAAPATPNEFTIEKYIVPQSGVIQIEAFNGSDAEVTIPQVIADDAYWDFKATPSTNVPPGGVVTFTLPYPWVAGELPEVSLMTSHGEVINSEVEPTLEISGEVSTTASSQ